MQIEIIEDYHRWSPPVEARRVIDRLLSHIPAECRAGLRSVVLTNSASRHERDKQVHKQHVLARYHASTRDSAAWIEVFVDRIVSNVRPLWLARFQPLGDVLFARPLFHELGHHINLRSEGGTRDLERAANAIEAKLTRAYFLRRYWYLMPFLAILVWTRQLMRKVREGT